MGETVCKWCVVVMIEREGKERKGMWISRNSVCSVVRWGVLQDEREVGGARLRWIGFECHG